jgi:hypothetical protein
MCSKAVEELFLNLDKRSHMKKKNQPKALANELSMLLLLFEEVNI